MEFKKRNFNNDDENRSDRDNNRDENRDNNREDNRKVVKTTEVDLIVRTVTTAITEKVVIITTAREILAATVKIGMVVLFVSVLLAIEKTVTAAVSASAVLAVAIVKIKTAVVVSASVVSVAEIVRTVMAAAVLTVAEMIEAAETTEVDFVENLTAMSVLQDLSMSWFNLQNSVLESVELTFLTCAKLKMATII